MRSLIRDITHLGGYLLAFLLVALGIIAIAAESTKTSGGDASGYLLAGIFLAWGMLVFWSTHSKYAGGLWSWVGCLALGVGIFGLGIITDEGRSNFHLDLPFGIAVSLLAFGAFCFNRGQNRNRRKDVERAAGSFSDTEPQSGAEAPKLLRSLPFVPAWLGLLLTGVFAWHFFTTAFKLVRFQDLCRKNGLPVRFSELNQWYPAVAPERNAARIYVEAFAKLTPSSSAVIERLTSDILRARRHVGGDPLSSAKIESVLRTNAIALDLLHRAAGFGFCRYPIDLRDGWATPVHHLAGIHTASRLLFLEAELSACQGSGTGAVESVVALLALGDSLAKEPIGLSMVNRNVCNGLAIGAIQNALNHNCLGEQQLVRLAQSLDRTEHTTDVSPAYLGELCVAFQQEPNQVIDVVLRKDGGAWQEFRLGTLKALVVITDRGYADKLFCAQRVLAYLKAVKNPYPLRLQMRPDPEESYAYAKRHFYPLSAYVLPKQEPILQEDARNCARIRVIQTVLDIERYRLRHGNKPPANLNDLCAWLGKPVRENPFDGSPLGYRSLPDSYLVYSSGPGHTPGSPEKESGTSNEPGGPSAITVRIQVGTGLQPEREPPGGVRSVAQAPAVAPLTR